MSKFDPLVRRTDEAKQTAPNGGADWMAAAQAAGG
jgi:hypothetical protein